MGRCRCGRAYLVQNASTYVQYGQYYAGTMRSALSGGQITVDGRPSVYIFHGMNLRLLPSQVSDTAVGVTPSPGTDINGASGCYTTGTSDYGTTGAHCNLYSNRF